MTKDSTITDFGTQPNVIATVDGVAITDEQPVAVGNYLVTTEEGTLRITKRTITVTTGTGSKVYDGTPLEGSTTKVEGTEEAYKVDNLAKNETLDVTVTGTITNAGTTANTYSIDWSKGTAKKDNYFVESVLGTLTITKATIPENPDDPEETRFDVTKPIDYVYDGQPHKELITVTDNGLPEGMDSDVTGSFTITYDTEDFTNVGTITITITAKEDSNYAGTVTRTYRITPRPITVTAQDAEKVYGTEDPTFTAVIDNMVEGESEDLITYTVTRPGAGTDEAAGTYEDAIVAAGEALQGNYSVTYIPADFTITKASLPEDPDDPENTRFQVSQPEDVIYNGSEQKQPVTVTDTLTGEVLTAADITITYSKDVTNVGTVTITITATEDGNYSGTFTRTYQILPKPLTIVADDQTKIYGEKDPKFTATIEGLVDGDKLDYKLTREEGEDVGNYTIHVVLPEDGNANYAITSTDGTLTITKRPVTFTSATDEKVYDGTPLVRNNPDYKHGDDMTIGGMGLAKGDEVIFTITGSQTYIGSSDNEFTWEFYRPEGGVVANALKALGILDSVFADGEDEAIAKNYEVVPVFGTLTVTGDPADEDVVTKTHEDKTYKVGETIVFTISVTNVYDEAKTITIDEQEGVEITGKSVFKNVAAGETVTTTAKYTVTAEDIASGVFKNTVTAAFSGGDIPTPDDPFKGEDEVKNFGHITVTKTVADKPEDGKVYRTGEEIEYKIVVTNDGTAEMTNIKVVDELTGDEWKIDKLAAGKSKTFKAEYIVTEADGVSGSVTNVATASGNDPDGDDTPGVEGKVTTKTDKSNEPTVPKTGDNTPIVEFSVIFGASIITLLMMLFRRRKERA